MLICWSNWNGSSSSMIATSLAKDRSLYCGWLNILDAMRSWNGSRSFVVCVSHSPARIFRSFASLRKLQNVVEDFS